MAVYKLDGAVPDLPPDGEAWIAGNATVIGRVFLGRGASIWFGAVIRADDDQISIGEGSNIQDNCVLHVDPGRPLSVGRGCTIGHRAILHGCEIGDNTLVGMGATILNGARVGRNCLIGAGALVTEGKTISDGTLVMGMPGKVVRELDAGEIRGLTTAAEQYQVRWRRFARDLEATG